MARTSRIVKGSKEVMKGLQNIGSGIKTQLEESVNAVARLAQANAQLVLQDADHRQKYGDTLVDEIGYSVSGMNAVVYAPVTNTVEMIAQMHYAEYGAGITSGQKWLYPTTEHDKNPSKVIYFNNGKPYRWTKYSMPVGYMRSARRFIIGNAPVDIRNRVNYVLGRKQTQATLNAWRLSARSGGEG